MTIGVERGRIRIMPRIAYEQAVYGSFPFWNRGYAMLAHSPGCRAGWLKEFERACQRYGEPGHGVSASGAMFAMRLPDRRAWMVVGVAPQGSDDRGRPGALAFHGLFVTSRELRKSRLGPFALTGAFREEWGPETTALESGVWPVESADETAVDPMGLAGRIARALRSGRKVVIEGDQPITELARDAWVLGGRRLRSKGSVATLAFSSANGFQFMAAPSWVADELEESYTREADLAAVVAPQQESSNFWWRRRGGRLAASGGLAVLLIAAAGTTVYQLRGRGATSATEAGGEFANPAATAVATGLLAAEGQAPVIPDHDTRQLINSEERQRVLEGLRGMAERYEVPIDPEVEADPTALMMRLSARLRYNGPWLSEIELAELKRDRGIEARRALEWHDHLRHFANDRRLPVNFVAGPLPWQLTMLSWSFRVEGFSGLLAAEVPVALTEALAVRWPVRVGTLAQRYPALKEYGRFLSKLPRR